MDLINLQGPAAIFFLVMGVVVVWMLFTAVPVRLWMEAWSSGVPIALGTLVGMRLRKVSPEAIVRPLIKAKMAGVRLPIEGLEAHYLAGGDVDKVVQALISANKAGIDLPWQQAAEIDLAGRDVEDEVNQRIAVASGAAHEMACPHCGRLFEIDRHILMDLVESLRDDRGSGSG